MTEVWSAEQIKEYLETVLRENQRAIELAADEREKAASALRDQLSERIAAGDTNLREHISAQVSQLRLMVENSETLSRTRHDATQREAKIQHDADQAAIDKAERANETRFASVNEWRGQSADRERTQQENIASFIATLTPLSKSEATEDKLAAAIERTQTDVARLTNRFDAKQGEATGVKVTTSVLVTAITVGIAIIGTIVLLANYFTTQ